MYVLHDTYIVHMFVNVIMYPMYSVAHVLWYRRKPVLLQNGRTLQKATVSSIFNFAFFATAVK